MDQVIIFGRTYNLPDGPPPRAAPPWSSPPAAGPTAPALLTRAGTTSCPTSVKAWAANSTSNSSSSPSSSASPPSSPSSTSSSPCTKPLSPTPTSKHANTPTPSPGDTTPPRRESLFAGPSTRLIRRSSRCRRAVLSGVGVGAGAEVFQEGGTSGCPAQEFLSASTGGGDVHAEESSDPAEVCWGILGRDGGDGQVEGVADRLGDLSCRNSFLGDRVQERARGCFLKAEEDEAGGIGAVHRGPPVLTVADIAGNALFPPGTHESGHEAVVARAVRGRREPHPDRVHASVEVVQCEVLAAAARGVGAVEGRGVVFGDGTTAVDREDARGEQERPARTFE